MVEIQIKTDNAAFEGDCLRLEVARILRDLSNKILDGRTPHFLNDTNGNRVGSVVIVNPDGTIDEKL